MSEQPADLDLTRLLSDAMGGDERASRQILSVLRDFAFARFMRHERAGHSLQATLLANEVFLQLLHHPGARSGQSPPDADADDANAKPTFANRVPFYCAAADVIRHVLVDHARKTNRQKR